jgi:hypothetical protein
MKFRIVFICIVLASMAHARPGCMDTSNHLQAFGDTKQEHYVLCYCPCNYRAPQHNRCLECGHKHVPQEMVIVTKKDICNKSYKKRDPYPHPHMTTREVMEHLIERRRKDSRNELMISQPHLR